MFGDALPRTPMTQPWDMFCMTFAELLFGITVLLNWGNTYCCFTLRQERTMMLISLVATVMSHKS